MIFPAAGRCTKFIHPRIRTRVFGAPVGRAVGCCCGATTTVAAAGGAAANVWLLVVDSLEDVLSCPGRQWHIFVFITCVCGRAAGFRRTLPSLRGGGNDISPTPPISTRPPG